MINLATMYVTKDVVEMFVNKKIALTTMVHHGGVICAYFYTLYVLNTNFNVEGIFKCFLGYAAFTSLDFPYEIYLALRFFINRAGRFNHFLKQYVFGHNFLCVICNFSWQTYYFTTLIISFHSDGIGFVTILISIVIYATLLSGWIQEEIVLMKHLWNYV